MADNQNQIPGQVYSGNKVDDHNQTFWGGAGTPNGMQINVGQASQSQGVNAIDPTANGYNQSLAAQFQRQALGQGPSLAQKQLQQATDQNLKGQAALAASGRNPAMSSYQAMQNAGNAAQTAAGQASASRLAEQYQAQQGLAGVTNQMQNAYGMNAQLGQQNNQFNAGAQNSNQQLQAQINMQQNQAYNGMMAGQQSQYNQYQQQHDLNEQQANNQLRNGMISTGAGAVGGALGGLASASDERVKTDVQPGGGTLQRFLDSVNMGSSLSSGAQGDDVVTGGVKNGMEMGKTFVGNLRGVPQAPGQGAPTGGSSGLPGASGAPGALSPGALNGGSTPSMPGSMPSAGSMSLSQPALGSSMAGAGGAGAGGLGALAALSDKRQKVGVKPGAADASSFLDRLKAHQYRYKDPSMPGAGEGKFVSPMAQELEKAGPVGQSMVQDTPNGKMVDYGKGFGTMLAAQADLHQRVKKLEQKKGSK